jgi:hypothetical protein
MTDENNTKHNPNAGKKPESKDSRLGAQKQNPDSANNERNMPESSAETKMRRWARIAGAGLGAAHTLGGLPYVFGWVGDLSGITAESNILPDPTKLSENPAESVNDKMTLAEAHASARNELGPNGYFIHQSKPYPTALPAELQAMDAQDRDRLSYGIMENYYEQQSAPKALAIPNEIQVLDSSQLEEFNDFNECFTTVRAQYGPGHFFEYEGKYYSTFTEDEYQQIQNNPELLSEYERMVDNEQHEIIATGQWYSEPPVATPEEMPEDLETDPVTDKPDVPENPEVVNEPVQAFKMDLTINNTTGQPLDVQMNYTVNQVDGKIEMNVSVNDTPIGKVSVPEPAGDEPWKPEITSIADEPDEDNSSGNDIVEPELVDDLPEIPENGAITEMQFESYYQEKYIDTLVVHESENELIIQHESSFEAVYSESYIDDSSTETEERENSLNPYDADDDSHSETSLYESDLDHEI